MYKIIGADGKEYGPVPLEQLRQWLAEGRVNSQTQVQSPTAADWKPLGELPEFASAAEATGGAVPPPISATIHPEPFTAQILAQDYSIQMEKSVLNFLVALWNIHLKIYCFVLGYNWKLLW